MARRCDITQSKPSRGHKILRSGLAKKKGGIGTHITARTPRTHLPNLKRKRVYIPELNRYVSVKTSARGLKTITKNGAYSVLKKAGLL